MSWATRGADKGKLRLAFYTDIHARTEWETPRAMQQAAQGIRASEPDMVIAGGDLITDGFTSTAEAVEPRWEAYMDMQRAIGQPVYPVLGNHDIVGARPVDGQPVRDVRAAFKNHLHVDQTFYAFDALGYHVVVLDSIHVLQGAHPYEGRIPSEQLDWLREDLSGLGRDVPIILCTHIPLMTTFHNAVVGYQGVMGEDDNRPPRSRTVVNSAETLACFDHHNLILVLQGHLHINEVVTWRGIPFITGGAVCAKWWRGTWYGTEEGFGLIDLDEDRVSWRYVDYGWDAKRP